VLVNRPLPAKRRFRDAPPEAIEETRIFSTPKALLQLPHRTLSKPHKCLSRMSALPPQRRYVQCKSSCPLWVKSRHLRRKM
jgi:hypothetical protein